MSLIRKFYTVMMASTFIFSSYVVYNQVERKKVAPSSLEMIVKKPDVKTIHD